MLTHGSHLIDMTRFLAGPLTSVRARRKEMFGAYSWFVEVEFANGAQGHLDLTVAVRMDYFEGFQIYGEHGSAVGKIYLPWFLKSADVECFSTRDAQYHRPLGADAHFYRRQLEAFADTILDHIGDDSVDRRFNFGERMAFGGRGIYIELREIEAATGIEGAAAVGDLLLDHERLVETAGRTTAKQFCQ